MLRTFATTALTLALAFNTMAQDFDVYVVDVGPNRQAPWQVLKYDQDGQNPEVFINAPLNRPQEVLFLEDRGEALVSNLGGNRITRHDAETGAYINDFAAGIGQPTRIRIGPDGLLYVVQWAGNGRVLRYQLDGTPMGEFTTVGVSQSIGLEWDSQGNMYVASFDAAHVRKFGPDGSDLGLFISSGLVGPTNIWFDDDGNMLVMDWSGGAIRKYSATGVFISNPVVGLSEPEGVDFLDNGDFLMGNGGTSSVRQYTAAGTFVKNFVAPGLGGLAKPNGVTIRRHASFAINPGLNDAWVNADAPFQGMFITVFADLGLVFVAWFTFDSQVPASNTATFGASDQRWVTGVGTIDGNQVVLNMELTTGGIFNGSDPMPVQDANYGTMTVVFSDCSNGQVTFDFPAPGLSGTFAITRT
ncbi:MAG: hypothetical protein HKN15_07670, partial [Xanthomonadales bacterium]|nr:hypothetical protein [Xanthomonadales bacterium]